MFFLVLFFNLSFLLTFSFPLITTLAFDIKTKVKSKKANRKMLYRCWKITLEDTERKLSKQLVSKILLTYSLSYPLNLHF
jgi:hypothetical protein